MMNPCGSLPDELDVSDRRDGVGLVAHLESLAGLDDLRDDRVDGGLVVDERLGRRQDRDPAHLVVVGQAEVLQRNEPVGPVLRVQLDLLAGADIHQVELLVARLGHDGCFVEGHLRSYLSVVRLVETIIYIIRY